MPSPIFGNFRSRMKHARNIIGPYAASDNINPKKNSAIGELAEKVENAIEQEKKINEDIHQCKGQITCNIGRIIDEIRKDDGK